MRKKVNKTTAFPFLDKAFRIIDRDSWGTMMTEKKQLARLADFLQKQEEFSTAQLKEAEQFLSEVLPNMFMWVVLPVDDNYDAKDENYTGKRGIGINQAQLKYLRRVLNSPAGQTSGAILNHYFDGHLFTGKDC